MFLVHFPRCQLVSVWHLLGKIQVEYEESTYATRWTLEPSSVPTHESHMSALVPKLDLWIYKDVIIQLMGPYILRGNGGTSDGRIFSITFRLCGSRALRSMMTGRRLTHQRLATWRIAKFSEIVSRQYAMAYDRQRRWPWRLPGRYGARTRPVAAFSGFAWCHSTAPSGDVIRVVLTPQHGHRIHC